MANAFPLAMACFFFTISFKKIKKTWNSAHTNLLNISLVRIAVFSPSPTSFSMFLNQTESNSLFEICIEEYTNQWACAESDFSLLCSEKVPVPTMVFPSAPIMPYSICWFTISDARSCSASAYFFPTSLSMGCSSRRWAMATVVSQLA